MLLFRAMITDADGKPKVGPAATMLGVRAGPITPPADVIAFSQNDLVGPGSGMSVAPNNPMNLTVFRRPTDLGGTGKNPVWVIETEGLGSILQFRFDMPPRHGLIEPSKQMTLFEFQMALAMTKNEWMRYNPLTE